MNEFGPSFYPGQERPCQERETQAPEPATPDRHREPIHSVPDLPGAATESATERIAAARAAVTRALSPELANAIAQPTGPTNEAPVTQEAHRSTPGGPRNEPIEAARKFLAEIDGLPPADAIDKTPVPGTTVRPGDGHSKIGDDLSGSAAGTDDTTTLDARQKGADRITAIETESNNRFVYGGDPVSRLDDWQRQGQNDVELKRTCAIATVREVGHQMGKDVTEGQLLHTVLENGWWDTNRNYPDNPKMGGVDEHTQQRLLASIGLRANTLHGQDLFDLAHEVENGNGVIVSVDGEYTINGGEIGEIEGLEDRTPVRPLKATHSLHVTGTIRSLDSSDLIGFIVNNPTSEPGQVINALVMQHGWMEVGGRMLVVGRHQGD